MSRYIDFYLIGELVDSHGNVHYEDLKNLPTADVVKKEKWDRLLKNSIILAGAIQTYQSADMVEINHGRWIDTGSGQECSICREIQYGYDSARNYCPNCGAKMDEREAEG